MLALNAFLSATVLLSSSVTVETLPAAAPVNWIGVSAPSPDVVWVSGSDATIGRSIDGGQTWTISKPSTTALEFRDIEALDSNQAYALSIGENGNSRVYYTSNGGESWLLRYRAGGEQFLNCMATAPSGEAWITGDTIDGRWDMVRSADGRNWLTARNAIGQLPQAGEGGLAASGGCIRFNNDVWAIGTANATVARILYKGVTRIRFQVIDTPIAAGPAAGIASVWPYSDKHMLMVGGDLNHPEARPRIAEYKDGDFIDWPEPPLDGALYSLTITPSSDVLVTNPSGAALHNASTNEWTQISEANIWNSACVADHCYLVGKEGYIGKFIVNGE